MRELTDMEVESVSGGDDYWLKIVNEVRAALGGNPGPAPGGIDPGMTPHHPILIQDANPAVL
jgi:hypothetical protein